MPIDFSSIKNSLYDWVSSVVPVGMPVIYYQPNAPRPTIPYLTLYLSTVNAVNQDWTSSSVDVNGVAEMKGDRQFILQIQAYGNDPLTVLENVRTSLQKESVLDTLRGNGIVFYQSITINDITDLVDSEFEKRAQLDISFAIGQVYDDTLGYFDTMEIEEVILNVDGTIVYDETVIIPEP
jgi:hypothetical protein